VLLAMCNLPYLPPLYSNDVDDDDDDFYVTLLLLLWMIQCCIAVLE